MGKDANRSHNAAPKSKAQIALDTVEPEVREVDPPKHTLRAFLDQLEEAGELERRREPVSLRELTRIHEASDKAMLFEQVAGCDTGLLANAMGTRRRFAIALGVKPEEVMFELARRITSTIEPVRVTDAPVQEVVVTGDDVDVTRLPVYLQHEFDGGPYVSAAVDVTRDAETGRYNAGIRRLMLRGRAETGIDLVAPSDMRALYSRARAEGRRFEAALVIGLHPLEYMATQLRSEADEYALMGGVSGEPLQLVRGVTIDLEVPAHAEIVLEGYVEGDWDNPEGPFGEYHGAYGGSHLDPIFKITAITRRRDAIYQTATIGGRNLAHTDQAVMLGLCTEVAVWEALKRAVAEPKSVYCPPGATGMHNVRIALNTRDPGDGRNAVLAALASTGNCKFAVAVDEDVDIFSDAMTEWAISTRSQPDTDVIVLSDMRTVPLDPSLPPRYDGTPVTTSKMGIDATRRKDKPSEIFDIPRPPFADAELPEAPIDGDRLDDVDALAERLLEVVGDGRRFVDFLAALPEVHEGDVVRALGELRERGEIVFASGGIYRRSGEEGQALEPALVEAP